MLCFSLVCVLCIVCHIMFALPFGVIDRLCSVFVAISGNRVYSFLVLPPLFLLIYLFNFN